MKVGVSHSVLELKLGHKTYTFLSSSLSHILTELSDWKCVQWQQQDEDVK